MADATQQSEPDVPGMSYGRPLDASDNRRFPIPATPDLLEHLADFNSRKTLLDLPILVPIALQIIAYFFFGLPKWAFLLSFLFWRAAYNAGLGFVLNSQSTSAGFTAWFSKMGLGMTADDLKRAKDEQSMPEWHIRLIELFRTELEAHLLEAQKTTAPSKTTEKSSPVNIDSLSIEFKSWMLFRFLVDTILLNDFFAYVIMALSFFSLPESWDWVDVGRFVLGIVLIQFNVWVKLDAHRVVRDYAWYWGVSTRSRHQSSTATSF